MREFDMFITAVCVLFLVKLSYYTSTLRLQQGPPPPPKLTFLHTPMRSPFARPRPTLFMPDSRGHNLFPLSVLNIDFAKSADTISQ